MNNAKLDNATHVVFAAFSLLLGGCSSAQSDGIRQEYFNPIINHQLVIANMTADLQTFRLCPEHAEMLAEQTADFGVLGMMTTVAAFGLDAEIDRRPIVVQQTSLEEVSDHTTLMTARIK